jgi:hypothetical protein
VRRPAALAAAAGLALVLALVPACGGGGDDDVDTTDVTSAPGAGGAAEAAADAGAAVGDAEPGAGETTTAPPPDDDPAGDDPAGGPGGGGSGGGGSGGPTAQVDLEVADVVAPTDAPDGVDACGTPTIFHASNLVDGLVDTAWRTPGDATGSSITLSLGGAHRVRTLGIVSGYAKVDPCDGTDRFAQNRRPTSVTWRFDDGSEVVQPLDDAPDLQTVAVDVTTSSVEVVMGAVSADPVRDFTAVSEIVVRGG